MGSGGRGPHGRHRQVRKVWGGRGATGPPLPSAAQRQRRRGAHPVPVPVPLRAETCRRKGRYRPGRGGAPGSACPRAAAAPGAPVRGSAAGCAAAAARRRSGAACPGAVSPPPGRCEAPRAPAGLGWKFPRAGSCRGLGYGGSEGSGRLRPRRAAPGGSARGRGVWQGAAAALSSGRGAV